MTTKLKVFGGSVIEGSRNVRKLVAAKSKAEVGRIGGIPYSRLKSFWIETKNDEEIAAALAEPGKLINSPLR